MVCRPATLRSGRVQMGQRIVASILDMDVAWPVDVMSIVPCDIPVLNSCVGIHPPQLIKTCSAPPLPVLAGGRESLRIMFAK